MVSSAEELSRVERVLQGVRERITRFQARGLGEQNTKATLIEPMLEVLGWDIRDPEQVHREFKPTSRDSPVDYALSVASTPRLFVEAKGLGENLQDRRWIAQVLGYATVAGVKWCVLTDGDEYRLYSGVAALDAEAKLFLVFRLSTGEPRELSKLLWMVSQPSLAENRLDRLWLAHFIERQVRSTLDKFLEIGDRRLIRLLRQELPDFSTGQLAAAMRRLRLAAVDAHSGSDEMVEGETKGAAVRQRRAAVRETTATSGPRAGRRGDPAARRRPTRAGGTTKRANKECELLDLLQARVLTAPQRLFHNGYRGRDFEAVLNADGTVTFAGTRFMSGSAAGSAAREIVAKRPMQTNGWAFWWVTPPDGRQVPLEKVREEFVSRNR